MTDAKPWWESKTVAINAVATVLIALEAQWHLLQPYLPFSFWMGMSIALPIINGVLRAVTSQPITFGGAGAQPLE
jgi:hypothetical protein